MSSEPTSAERLSVALTAFGVGFVGLAVGLTLGILSFVVMELTPVPGAGTPTGTAVSSVAQGAGLVVVGAAYMLARDLEWSYLRVAWPSLRDGLWVVATAVALFASFAVLLVVARQVGLEPTTHTVQRAAREDPAILLPLIPLSVLVTGPAEEFLYRGVVQTSLLEAFDTVVAVLVAAGIFALVHLPAYGLGTGLGPELATTLAMLFVLGAVLGVVYEHTGNLVVPVVGHGLYNAIAFTQMYLDAVGAMP